jgi:nitroreductase
MKRAVITFVLIQIIISMNAQDIRLPEPKKSGGKPLMEALAERKSTREFSPEALSYQQISDLLWAGNGINRENGKRTAPSARNCQEIDIYVVLPEGIYLHDPKTNSLLLKKPGKFIQDLIMQEFDPEPPLLFIFVANYDKMGNMTPENMEFYGATDCGYVSQNIYLYCASENLNRLYWEELIVKK